MLREIGVWNTFRKALKTILRCRSLPGWLLYKFQNQGFAANFNRATDPGGRSKEDLLREFLNKHKERSFLEIGIGAFPNIARLRQILSNNIAYSACDFESVCNEHRKILELHKFEGIDRLRFLPNKRGTYSWTLFSLLREKNKFDVIYLDGHHTFYVDLPAFALADFLLKPGGFLIIDDVEWTLNFVRGNMARRFDDWFFYRKIYDFSQYTLEEADMPHLKLIAEELMEKKYGYSKEREFCLPDWWILRKPVTDTSLSSGVVQPTAYPSV